MGWGWGGRLGRTATLVIMVATSKQVVAENGLGEDFQPSVKASCVGGTMTIRVDTAQPFDGVVHGPNRTEPGCSVQGTGGLKTYLKVLSNHFLCFVYYCIV